MRLRSLLFITLIGLCHPPTGAQVLTHALPAVIFQSAAPVQSAAPDGSVASDRSAASDLPNDPGLELLPDAIAEPAPPHGAPVRWDADRQSRSGDKWTLQGNVALYYGDYILHADRIVYHQSATTVEAEGHLQLTGGPEDILLTADHGEMRLNAHTGRFYQIRGSLGMRRSGHAGVYASPDPLIFSGRELLQRGPGSYQIIDGSMTNCRLPKPDWELLSRSIEIKDGHAVANNLRFQLFGAPIFYLPFLRHSADGDPRQSGLLIPIISFSTIKGLTLGEQVYVVLGRSADLTIGSEYYGQRGFSPNGDLRFRGQQLDSFNARWNALLDHRTGVAGSNMGNQGGVDILAEGRHDFSSNTRLAGKAEFLSRYLYRLVFNNSYVQATDSTVRSEVAYTTHRDGLVLSANASRMQSFSGISSNDEVRILHLPGLHVDVIDEPLGSSPLYGDLNISMDHMTRAELGFHAYNDGRFDVHPRLSLPFGMDGWRFAPSIAARVTGYSNAQVPDLTYQNGGIPVLDHDSLLRRDVEATLDVRPPAVERDYQLSGSRRLSGSGQLSGSGRLLRHVIEPEFHYRFVSGIGREAQRILLADTSDIVTDTNEAGFSLTQRIYIRSRSIRSRSIRSRGPQDAQDPGNERSCATEEDPGGASCRPLREWASWQIAQEYYFDSQFGGAVLPGRRMLNESSLGLTGTTFLTGPRSSSPVISRIRFEAIQNLRLEWDIDYDIRAGRIGASNLFSGYSRGRTTFGLGHSLLNAAAEQTPSQQLHQLAEAVRYQQLQPFLTIGKPTDRGLSVAANGGYDLNHGVLQFGGIQAVYNRGCCGIMLGYRHFALGTVREEDQYLYGFTLAGFGTAGDIRRTNSVFRDPKLPPLY